MKIHDFTTTELPANFSGFTFHPCKNSGENSITECPENEAEFFGIYAIHGKYNNLEWVADVYTKKDAEILVQVLSSVGKQYAHPQAA